jgi:ABC-type Fe3+ transport system permease subunit
VRFTIPGVVLGIGLYWAFQHFSGMGNTGKSKAAS